MDKKKEAIWWNGFWTPITLFLISFLGDQLWNHHVNLCIVISIWLSLSISFWITNYWDSN